MKKYKWLPTECASKRYPMRILNGNLFFEDEGSIYLPDGRLIFNGWGKIGSIHLVGEEFKPVPERLNVAWFSFTENKFYAIECDLPHTKMRELFSNGYIGPADDEKTTYSYVMIGLAPKGGIAVWLSGGDVTTEICFIQAKEASIDWSRFFSHIEMSREEFVQFNLEQVLTNEDLISLKRDGIPSGLYNIKYRTYYPWEPFIIGNLTANKILLQYFNGEREYIDYESDENKTSKRTVPRELTVSWTGLLDIKYSAEIEFDEHEIFSAFEKFAHEAGLQDLKLQIDIHNLDYSLKLFLRNDKYILEFQKCNIKVYSSL
jgi:hypothetical protein